MDPSKKIVMNFFFTFQSRVKNGMIIYLNLLEQCKKWNDYLSSPFRVVVPNFNDDKLFAFNCCHITSKFVNVFWTQKRGVKLQK